MKEISKEKDFDEEIKEGVVVVDFYAEWCGPCKMLTPLLEEIDQEMEEIELIKVNVDESPEISAEYFVRSIPTVVIFKNGELVDRHVGAQPKKSYLEIINKFI